MARTSGSSARERAPACANDSPVPTAPTTSAVSVPAADASAGHGTHAHPLTAIVGEGTGHVNITPEASQDGFSVEVQVSVRWTEPNAEFLLTRSVDFVPDGVCTGTIVAQRSHRHAQPLHHRYGSVSAPAGVGVDPLRGSTCR